MNLHDNNMHKVHTHTHLSKRPTLCSAEIVCDERIAQSKVQRAAMFGLHIDDEIE